MAFFRYFPNTRGQLVENHADFYDILSVETTNLSTGKDVLS